MQRQVVTIAPIPKESPSSRECEHTHAGFGLLPTVVDKGSRKGLHDPAPATSRGDQASVNNEASALFPTQPITMKSGRVYYIRTLSCTGVQDVNASKQGVKLSRTTLTYVAAPRKPSIARRLSTSRTPEVAQRDVVRTSAYAKQPVHTRAVGVAGTKESRTR
ncbi:hypothetical protein MRX96_005270 [Rhipicephalus microplus]